jgi:hypothetical protein
MSFLFLIFVVQLKIIKNCELMSKYYAMFYLLLGVGFFCIFAYDIEYDRDYSTWMFLLSSILWFFNSLIQWINFLLKENK